MRGVFAGATTFNQDISAWNVSNVTIMEFMFQNANFFNQSIGQWEVDSVTNMRFMFNNATAFNQNIDSWNVSSVKEMSAMFQDANSFNQPLNSWNVSNVTEMSLMFTNAALFNQDVGLWNMDSVMTTFLMFLGATSFNQDIGLWNISSTNNMVDMLYNSGLSVENYDNTLIGWESQGFTNKNLGATNLKYCNADSVRSRLINNYGWTITGDTYDCSGVNTKFLTVFQILEIYPNPTNGQFFISAEFEKPLNDVQIEIINTNGQIVKQITLGNKVNTIQKTINLSSVAKGSYYVLIRSDVEQIGKMILVD